MCCEVELSEEDSTWILSLPQELLSVPEIDGGSVLIARARSASDAAMLRRKGHLKGQGMPQNLL